jgi:hypothetical protein
MSRFLHTLSAILFYLLGGSYFLAIVLNYNDIAGTAPRVWMDIMDLPLLLTGLLFGGISLYRSVRSDGDTSHALIVGLAFPLVILFGLMLITNFLAPAV